MKNYPGAKAIQDIRKLAKKHKEKDEAEVSKVIHFVNLNFQIHTISIHLQSKINNAKENMDPTEVKPKRKFSKEEKEKLPKKPKKAKVQSEEPPTLKAVIKLKSEEASTSKAVTNHLRIKPVKEEKGIFQTIGFALLPLQSINFLLQLHQK